MKIVFDDVKLFRDIINAVGVVVEEATLKVDNDGIKLRALDLAEVSMVDLFLPKSLFTEYDVEPTEVTFRVSDALKLLKASSNETMTIIPEENQLKFRIIGEFTREFGIPRFTSATREAPPLNITLNNIFTTSVKVLKYILNNGRYVSDTLRIETATNKVILLAQSDVSSIKVELTAEDGTLIEPKISPDVRQSYDLLRLQKIVGALTFVDLVKISFDTDMPLKMGVNLNSEGFLTYYVAPKLEE
ncbi:hypothetical protein B6U74_03560 [Candidatus Bathyarchaeota archaeon ex4484_205]|nr:MAG: hypothetical protein B6U74_03560 [Candidatus Bathyarchaeota archaeon ex4484_205]RLG69094.1 MAG: hypothetical protein DRN93_01080 [archaeon]